MDDVRTLGSEGAYEREEGTEGEKISDKGAVLPQVERDRPDARFIEFIRQRARSSDDNSNVVTSVSCSYGKVVDVALRTAEVGFGYDVEYLGGHR
jgi:hypothetical protein